jgi:hypothetical protein
VPQVVKAETGLTNDMILVLRLNAEKKSLKIVEELKRSEPKIFTYLRTAISDESTDQIREHADWDECLQRGAGAS